MASPTPSCGGTSRTVSYTLLDVYKRQAHDLAGTPHTGISIPICGDAHLRNFGGFATPERQFLFDLNDFDETATGPWEWDVKRLTASLAVAAAHMGLSLIHI